MNRHLKRYLVKNPNGKENGLWRKKDHMACIYVITKMMAQRLEEKKHSTKNIDQFTKK